MTALLSAGNLERIKQDAERGLGASSGDTLRLLAEVDRLNADNLSLRGSCKQLGAEHAGMVRTIKKFEALRKDAERWRFFSMMANDLQAFPHSWGLMTPEKMDFMCDEAMAAAMSKGERA